MKVYVDRAGMKLLGVEKERPFYTGDRLSSSLTVYFNTDVSTSSVTLSFLLSNGRTPRRNLIPDSNATVTLSEAVLGQTTWYSYTWNLSSKEGILVAPGLIQMTLAVTTNEVVEQVQFTNNVVRTSRFGDNENIVVFGDDSEEIILDFRSNIDNINSRLSVVNLKLDTLNTKFDYIGDYTNASAMYNAVFEAIYTNGGHVIVARLDGNVCMFMRSDNENEEYLCYLDCSTYSLYRLKSDGTLSVVGFMPQRLSILPQVNSNVPNSRLLIGVQDSNENGANKMVFTEIQNRIIKTCGTSIPNNAQEGQYLFVEISNE